jgi:protein-tyrosine phosphatase
MPFCHGEKDVTEILPNLWLGNYKSSQNTDFIQRFNIKYIVNVTADYPNLYPYVKYLVIPINDDDLCGKNINKIFDQATEFIANGLASKSSVLVHCKYAHHRSASIIVSFLIRYLNINVFAGIKYINSLRKCALTRNTCMVNGLFSYYIHRHKNVEIAKIDREHSQCHCIACNKKNKDIVTLFDKEEKNVKT